MFLCKDWQKSPVDRAQALRNGKIVGRICSGMFRDTVGAPLGFGCLASGGAPVSAEWIAASRYEVEVADERIAARVSLRPLYYAASERVKQ